MLYILYISCNHVKEEFPLNVDNKTNQSINQSIAVKVPDSCLQNDRKKYEKFDHMTVKC